MKAQWRWGTAQGTVNTAGLQAQQPPRVGTASTRVVGRVWGKGRAGLQGSKRGRGNSQPSVALWAKIMESSGVKRMNTERDLKTQQTQSWLDSFIPYLKLIRLARNSNSLYIELQGWKKNKRASCWVFFKWWVHFLSVQNQFSEWRFLLKKWNKIDGQ